MLHFKSPNPKDFTVDNGSDARRVNRKPQDPPDALDPDETEDTTLFSTLQLMSSGIVLFVFWHGTVHVRSTVQRDDGRPVSHPSGEGSG